MRECLSWVTEIKKVGFFGLLTDEQTQIIAERHFLQENLDSEKKTSRTRQLKSVKYQHKTWNTQHKDDMKRNIHFCTGLTCPPALASTYFWQSWSRVCRLVPRSSSPLSCQWCTCSLCSARKGAAGKVCHQLFSVCSALWFLFGQNKNVTRSISVFVYHSCKNTFTNVWDNFWTSGTSASDRQASGINCRKLGEIRAHSFPEYME